MRFRFPTYVTSYCNFPHRIEDGKPVEHECVVIPHQALAAERAGDTQRAFEIIDKAKPLRVMRRGVRA